MLDSSYLPLLGSTLARNALIILNLWFNEHVVTVTPWNYGKVNNLFSGLLLFIPMFLGSLFCFFAWFGLIRSEVGGHTVHLSTGFRLRFIWFLVSEVMLFFGFFWFYFNCFVSSDRLTGGFPNYRMVLLDAWGVPLFNTVILLSSRFTLTYSHHCMVTRYLSGSYVGIVVTILQGIIFTYYQYEEYCESSFTIGGGSFGSIFFMATGFHRAHVLIGTAFLIFNSFRLFINEYSPYRHVRFELGAWYWHFVDVVWLFLFFFIYALN